MNIDDVPGMVLPSNSSNATDQYECQVPFKDSKEFLLFDSHSSVNRIALVVFQIVLIIPTLVLNAIIIIALAKDRKLWRSANILVGFLAITDAFVAICSMPLFLSSIIMELVHGERSLDTRDYCTLSKAALNSGDLGMGWSFITISLITFERYVAIFYPFWYRKYVTRSILVKTTVVIWIIWAFVVLILVLNLSVQFILGISILVLVILVYVLAVPAYLRIVFLLNKIESNQATTTNQPRIDRKGSITCAIMLFCILVCYTPLMVVSTLIVATGGSSMSINYALPWGRFLVLSNSFFNPLIYLVRNQLIRRSVQNIFKGFFKKTDHPTVAPAVQPALNYGISNPTAAVVETTKL